jgi:DNA polymerase elongation subunit (family B)
MEVFPYAWNTYEENGALGIRIFGMNKENESVFVLATGFTPYIYVELPDHIDWQPHRVQALSTKLDTIVDYGKPIRKVFLKKKKLYYAKKLKNSLNQYVEKTYPFLKCFFSMHTSVRPFVYKLAKALYIDGIGTIKLKAHEQDANPLLQFMCMNQIKPAGWFTFTGGKKIVSEDDRLSSCAHEFEVAYQKIVPVEKNMVCAPLIMGFDIEVNSSNPNVAPRVAVPEDKVFQISCVFLRNGEPDTNSEKYILSLGKNKKGELIDLVPETVGEDTEILLYNTESELLQGFTDLVMEKNPQIITGYNIFSFDLPYMYERAKLVNCLQSFDQISCILGEHCKEKEISWSSSAFKNQKFTYIDAPGRLWVDMLPIIQRDYKLENYKLKTVSDYFLGDTKDPLTVKGIFKCYRMFTPESLSVVAKYCVKDSELVVKLFEKLQVWIGLTEMANTCNTPVFTLFTQGQQIKIFSQVYKKCMADDIVIDKDSFVVNEDDHFTGAYVFTPEPGLYDMVVSFDFSSLYPSTIIAYNIDYSTLVLDESIPDDQCNIFEWSDHQNCGCPNAKIVKANKGGKIVMCKENRFRFMKEPAGVIPTLLKNLLDARKRTNTEMKRLKGTITTLTGEEKSMTERLVTVLDKRQLSYKVSANSMYGGMGVKKGYLPFLPGAMCTTARGRQSIEKASKFLIENYNAKLIYGDTDSCYISFPQYQDGSLARELDQFCRQIEEETSSLFPRPMKFAYEEAIYWRYLILSKKRYMALKCDLDGKVSSKIEKRGVLLSRRDNSAYSRDVYSKLIMKAFYKSPIEEILVMLNEEFTRLACGGVTLKDLMISKSVGDIKDYKIRPLPDDDKKLEKRLIELDIFDRDASLQKVKDCFRLYTESIDLYQSMRYKHPLEHLIVEAYINKALPSQVQLAEKMRRRGTRVDAGERLGYCVVQSANGMKDKLFDKIEDVDYLREHSDIVKIDSLYYTKLLINPTDEVLEAAYKTVDVCKKYYKAREQYWKVVNQLRELFSPAITLCDDEMKDDDVLTIEIGMSGMNISDEPDDTKMVSISKKLAKSKKVEKKK